MKKIFCIGLAILISTPCFAIIEEDEIQKPIHYSLVPSVGYHLAFSELSGKNSASTGFFGGLGFKFSRDGWFFTPNIRLLGLVGLDKSPLSMLSYGFMAGGRLNSPNIDLYVGADSATIISYKTDSAAVVKVGTSFDLGLSDFQLFIQGFYSVFTVSTQVTTTSQLQQSFPYVGAEIGFQFPIEL